VHTQLESLKVQLQPHFLFNTLNTILALIRTEPATAERMVSGLSELLRASLEAAGEHEVPLERELAILRPYLEIQQVRFRDRLAVLLDVDPAARGALVPYLILQPLVENAIRHGLAPRASAGRVEISASVLDDALRLEVRDDGVGIRAPSAMREGVGLGNTRARLRHLYGTRHAFEARPRAEGGFAVRVEIPYRPAGSDVLVETHA
jgi:LytS/YehU family sensor histidine kinase